MIVPHDLPSKSSYLCNLHGCVICPRSRSFPSWTCPCSYSSHALRHYQPSSLCLPPVTGSSHVLTKALGQILVSFPDRPPRNETSRLEWERTGDRKFTPSRWVSILISVLNNLFFTFSVTTRRIWVAVWTKYSVAATGLSRSRSGSGPKGTWWHPLLLALW